MTRFFLLLSCCLSCFAQQLSPHDPAILTKSSSLRNGLQTYWSLEESVDPRYDRTILGNKLTNSTSVGNAVGMFGNAASFVRASSQFLTSPLTNFYTGASSFTVTLWAKFTTLNSESIFEKASRMSIIEKADHTGIMLYVYTNSSSGIQIITATHQLATNTWYLIAAGYDKDNNNTWIKINSDNTVKSPALNAPPYTSASVALKIGGANYGYMDGKVDEVGIWNRKLADWELNIIFKQGYGCRFPWLSSSKPYYSNIICDGDSITAGYGLTPRTPFPYLLSSSNSMWSVTNVAVSGYTLLDMFAYESAKLGTSTVIAPTNILVAWGGSNDIYGGASAATTLTRYSNYCVLAKTKLFKVVVMPVIYRSQFDAGKEAIRQTFNTSLSTAWTNWADAFINLNTLDSRFETGDAAVFQVDGVHPNQTGQDIIAGFVQTALDSL